MPSSAKQLAAVDLDAYGRCEGVLPIRERDHEPAVARAVGQLIVI
jgi:hypothetical protein